VFQVDFLKGSVPERKKIVVPHPLAGTFKVTNGDFLCEMSLGGSGVGLVVKNRRGKTEKFSTTFSV